MDLGVCGLADLVGQFLVLTEMQKQTHSLFSQAQMHIVKCCCIGLLIVVMNEKDNHLISFNFLKKFLKIELFPFLYKIPATALTH